jgi:hypothetical protein
MNDQEIERRIHRDPAIFVCKPVIRGTRIPVSLILNYIEHGHTTAVVMRAMERFFRNMDAQIDLARSLVVVTEHRVRVVGPLGRNISRTDPIYADAPV